MNPTELTQGSPEWHKARLGSLGASCLHEALAKTKIGYSASRANRMAALIVERMTGEPQETYQNGAMLRGTELEPEAREAYSFFFDREVKQTGLWKHPTIAGTHASPDGLVGDDGLVEIKVPNSATHLDYLLTGKISKAYQLQVDWQLVCTGRQWCDFVSYDPRMPEKMKFFVLRMPAPPDAVVNEMEREVKLFLEELDEKERLLRQRFAIEEAA